MQDDTPELATEIIAPLKLQGVAEVVDNALVLRFKFTARPVKPSWVQREYLKRLLPAFAEKGIRFATGTTMVLQGGTGPFPVLTSDDPNKPADRAAAAAATTLAAAEIMGAAAGE